MSTDDPFAPFESDRTIIKPNPGGRATAPARPAQVASGMPPATVPPMSYTDAAPVDKLFGIGGCVNPLVAAAAPLLRLVAQLRTMASCANPQALRDSIVQMVRKFEAHAKGANLPNEQVMAARYILCTFVDEAAAGTPWGAGVWSKESLLVLFHNETWGGEKVFQLLARLAENPAAQINLLELLYIVLGLGFEGRYRVTDNGKQQVESVRERLYQMIRKQRGEPERDLSPHWRGAATARRRVSDVVPVWVGGAAAALLLAVAYLGLSFALNRQSDPVFGMIAAIKAPAALPTVVKQAPKPRLAEFLAPEIKAEQVAVQDEIDRSVITVRGDGFFEPGSAAVSPRVAPLLSRIAAALNSVPGQIEVTGHTDNQPIRSMRYPSNWHLSQDRANSVVELLRASVMSERLKGVGKADADPVAPNDSAAGRARNRRVEITLFVKPDA